MFFGNSRRRLLSGVPSARRSLGLGILAHCGEILMANEPACTITMEQFPCPFYIANRYQNFTTFAPGNPQKFRLQGGPKNYGASAAKLVR